MGSFSMWQIPILDFKPSNAGLMKSVTYRYIDRKSAQDQGIIRNEGSSVYVGVDYWNHTSTGRQSVRLESKRRFTKGLFVLDLQHMPGSICGTWPAL